MEYPANSQSRASSGSSVSYFLYYLPNSLDALLFAFQDARRYGDPASTKAISGAIGTLRFNEYLATRQLAGLDKTLALRNRMREEKRNSEISALSPLRVSGLNP